jgi:hypothetical protein
MRPAVLLALLLLATSLSASAQQFPAAAGGKTDRPHDTTSGQAPEGAPHADAPSSSSSDLATLVRAQTDAIKALKTRVDELERRVSKLEKGKPGRP